MTWSQTVNIQDGHHKFIKEEHERRIIENRVLCSYFSNMMSKDPKPFEKIYPISTDNLPEKKKTKNVLSIEQFHRILTEAFKNNE